MPNLRFVLASLFCLMVSSTVHAAPPTTTYFPANGIGQFLVEQFDLASIRSSFGPRRSPALRTFADFQLIPTKATDSVLEFESANRFYRLRIAGRRDVNGDGIEDLEVCFTDEARGGANYYSQQSLLITRYSPHEYAVALNYSVDACAHVSQQVKNDVLERTPGDTRNGRDYERVGRFIYAFQRAGVSVDELKSADIARHAPPELATRAKRLAQKFEFIVKANASVPDAEIDMTLREAAAVSAAIADWRRSIAR